MCLWRRVYGEQSVRTVRRAVAPRFAAVRHIAGESSRRVMAPRTDWNPLLRGEFQKPYWRELQDFVRSERAMHTVYPPADEVFSALHFTPYASVKVLILGQDPYHGPRQAHGLCFSVRPGVAQPPSLRQHLDGIA